MNPLDKAKILDEVMKYSHDAKMNLLLEGKLDSFIVNIGKIKSGVDMLFATIQEEYRMLKQ